MPESDPHEKEPMPEQSDNSVRPEDGEQDVTQNPDDVYFGGDTVGGDGS